MSGTEVDIVTGFPLELVERERQQAAEAEDKGTMLRQAGFMGVAESEAAAVLLGLIEERLTARVHTLVSLDAEAKAFIELLKKFGERKFSAQLAAKELVRKYGKS